MSRGRPKLANRLSQKTDESDIQDGRVVSVSENLIVDRQQRRIIEQDNKLINMEQQLQLLKSKQQKGFEIFSTVMELGIKSGKIFAC
jgi:hypothetical protein